MTHAFPLIAYQEGTHWYWPWREDFYYCRAEDGTHTIYRPNGLPTVEIGRMQATRMDAFGFPRRTIQTWRMDGRTPTVWAATIALPEGDRRRQTCSGLHFDTSMEKAIDTAYRTMRRVRRACKAHGVRRVDSAPERVAA